MRVEMVVLVLVCALEANASAGECTDGPSCQAQGERIEAKDANAAFALYDRGCKLHYELSCAAAALMSAGGEGGPADSAEAHRRLDQACKGGIKRACE